MNERCSPFFTSPDSADVAEQQALKKTKRLRKNIPGPIRSQSWDLFMGPGTQKGLCPMCNRHMIENSVMYGFEAAHITADKWFDNTKISIFHCVPSCHSCNGVCKVRNVFDYLYDHGRYDILVDIAMKLYKVYVNQHAEGLGAEDRLAWKVIRKLYGQDAWPAGGGIQNVPAVYNLIRAAQSQLHVERIAELTKQLQETTTELRSLAEEIITVPLSQTRIIFDRSGQAEN